MFVIVFLSTIAFLVPNKHLYNPLCMITTWKNAANFYNIASCLVHSASPVWFHLKQIYVKLQ